MLPEVASPEVDRCVQRGIYEKTFSGAACVGSVRGEIFHRAAYGNGHTPPPRRPVDLDAVFDLASLTKPLATGLGALVLAGQGRLDLNAPLTATLPEFRQQPAFAQATVGMLLEHTAGFPATRPYWQRVADPNGRESTLAVDAVRRSVAEDGLAYPPGTQTIYSDVGFMVLGWVLEGVVKQPWERWLAQTVYRPLGVEDALFFLPRGQPVPPKRRVVATENCPWRGRVLVGEVHDPNAWALGGVAGHAGLFGTADGVWTVVRALLDSYHGDSRAFAPGTVRRFWTRSKRAGATTWALGWDTPDARAPSCGRRFSRTAVGHLGFTGGSIWVDLSTDLIAVALTNAVHPSAEGKREAMARWRPRLHDLLAQEGSRLNSG